jgi:hypothetical protein
MSFDAARAIFNQVDTNRDGGIDRNEFTRWVNGANVGGASNYESSSFNSGNYGGDAVQAGGYNASASFGGAGFAGNSSSSFESSNNYGVAGQYAAQGLDASSSSFSSQSTQQTYATNAQGLYQDPNPQIIRRPAVGGVQTYTQNIRVRFLQPPPVPPPGVRNLSFAVN